MSWSFSVKRRDTISSGFMRKRISSCRRPESRTPPPSQLEAKSTWTRSENRKERSSELGQLGPACAGLSLPAACRSLQSRWCRTKTHTAYSSSPHSWQGIKAVSKLNPLQLLSFCFFSLVVVRSTFLQRLIFTISRVGHQCLRGNASQRSPVRPVWFLQTHTWLHPNTAGRVVKRRSRLQRCLKLCTFCWCCGKKRI